MQLKRRIFFLHNLCNRPSIVPPTPTPCPGPQCISLPWLQGRMWEYIFAIVSSMKLWAPPARKKEGQVCCKGTKKIHNNPSSALQRLLSWKWAFLMESSDSGDTREQKPRKRWSCVFYKITRNLQLPCSSYIEEDKSQMEKAGDGIWELLEPGTGEQLGTVIRWLDERRSTGSKLDARSHADFCSH